MKAIQLSRGVLAAAVLGALAPAFAQSTSNATTQQPRTSQAMPSAATTMSDTKGTRATTSANGATPATAATKPLCSSLNHPQAGKLADKSTGMAKENSASPVHMDCIPDSEAAASGAVTGSANAGSLPSGAAAGSMGGSATAGTSSVTGDSPDVNSSVTGSTSTVNPTIDLRGRSSVTIDNNTSTGDQSLSSSTAAATGDQSLNSSATAKAKKKTTSSATAK